MEQNKIDYAYHKNTLESALFELEGINNVSNKIFFTTKRMCDTQDVNIRKMLEKLINVYEEAEIKVTKRYKERVNDLLTNI